MKKLTAILLIGASTLGMYAAPLTPEQALKRALSSGRLSARGFVSSSIQLSYTTQTTDGTPAVYIFNRPDASGYLVISAYDEVTPILGYADNGTFDINEIPPQMQWWISQYTKQIEDAATNGAKKINTSRSTKAAITPLVKTKWNQGVPYNNLCPVVNTVKCPTGCVATSMAQVMKYWNYPDVGTGRVTATMPSGATGSGFINLSQKPFDWNNMLDSYSGYDYTNEQANAVATLMQAAGYAARMNYSLGGSGAISINAATSLSKNFKYNPNIQYLQREYFTAEGWEELVYNELAAGRPIIYGGQSTSVGHSFVCDGYDGNGYYHFNWGWGGMSDGYFLLNALDPDSVGTGGGAGGGYNSGQDIIIGIQPTSETVNPYLTQFGNLSATASGLTLSLLVNNGSSNWLNTGITAISVNLGVEISPADGAATRTQYAKIYSNAEIPALTLSGYNISYQGIKGNARVNFPSNLPNGTYKVTVCTQNCNVTDAPWTPVCATNGAYNFVYVTKNGNSCSVRNFNETELTIESAATTTQVYYGNACRIKLSVANNSNIELSGGFYPVLLDGSQEAMLGEGIYLNLKPGEKTEREFLTVFELLDGATAPTASKQYTLKFLKDPNRSNYYNWSEPLTVNVNPGTLSFTISDYCIENAPTRQETINGKPETVYVASNSSDIPFSANIKNTGSFFGSQVYTLIFNGNLQGYSLTSGAMGPTPVLDRGEAATVKGSVDFSAGELGKYYAATIFHVENGSLKQSGKTLLYFTIDPSSAVNEIEKESDETDCIIFNLQGMPVGNDLKSLPTGIYIRNGKKVIVRH